MHDEAARAEDTDWPQILALYGLLDGMSDNPMVTLNRAVAAAMVHGPAAGLALLDRARSATNAGRPPSRSTRSGRTCSRWRATPRRRSRTTARAAQRTTSTPERDYLLTQASRLANPPA